MLQLITSPALRPDAIVANVDPLIPGYGQTIPRSASRTRQHHLNVAQEPSWLS